MMAKKRIVLVSFPMGSSSIGDIFLSDLIDIIQSICDEIYVISGSKFYDKKENINFMNLGISLHLKGSIHPLWWSNILQILKIIYIQIKMCYILLTIYNHVDVAFFYLGGPNFVLPVAMSKILGIKVISAANGLGSHSYNECLSNNKIEFRKIIYYVLKFCESFIFYLSDRIIVQSDNVVSFLGLEKYNRKIVNGSRFIDTAIFRRNIPQKDRANVIGYIGRMSYEKGVLNFIKGASIIIKDRSDLGFIISGDGPLMSMVINVLIEENLTEKIKIAGWVSHDKIGSALNDLKLLVLPSYSEGLPTIVLEAMASGTPVLATSVGGIPDIIKDENTGFIMENNMPKCIAKNIIRALDHPRIEDIINNAEKLVENDYSYISAIERYKAIIDNI